MKLAIQTLLELIQRVYGNSLISLAIFGSYARGEAKPSSDIDLLLILKDPPKRISHPKRNEFFVREIELPLDDFLTVEISPLILYRKEAASFNPLYLDMVSHHLMIIDRRHFLKNILIQTARKMKRWGSSKHETGGHWYWKIKPGIKWGEIIDYDK